MGLFFTPPAEMTISEQNGEINILEKDGRARVLRADGEKHKTDNGGSEIKTDSWPVMTKEQVATELVARIAAAIAPAGTETNS